MTTENKIKSAFLLTEYNYQTGRQQVVSVCTDKYNALAELQDRVIRFIQEKDGLGKINADVALEKYTYAIEDKTIDVGEILKNNPNGHYILVNPNEHFHKWVVWQKYEVEQTVRGYLGKYTTKVSLVRKVFDIDVVEMPFSIFSTLYRKYRYLCVEHKLLKAQTCDKSEATDEMIYQRNYTQSVCSDFSKLLSDIPAFKTLGDAVNDAKELKLSELMVVSPNDFSKYKKVFYATPVIRPTKTASEEGGAMYMSLMEDITESIEHDDTANTLGDLIKPLIPAIEYHATSAESQISIGVQKKLAKEAINALSELQVKRAERIMRDKMVINDAELSRYMNEKEMKGSMSDIKPPWMSLKKM